MGSLFQGLFAAPKQQDGSPGGQGLFSSSSKYAALPLAAAPAAPVPSSKGKRRKEEAAASAASAEPSKKSRKAQQQQRQQRGRQEPKEQQQEAQQQQRGAAAPAAAAPAAHGASAKASSKPGKREKGSSKPAAEAAAEQRPSKAGRAAAVPTSSKAAEPAAAPRGRSGKAEAPADERLPRTVFVGNLPATVKRKALARVFAAAGAVESVRLRSLPLKQEPESKVPRKNAIAMGRIDTEQPTHAYVVFEEEEAVDKALALNMTEFEGHHIRVDRAAPASAKGAVAFDHMRTLFVGNLPHDAKDEELIQHFGATAVEAVRVVRDGKTGAGKGVAFVLFRSQEASKAALRAKGKGELRGRKLRLTVAKKQAAASDKPAAWQQGKDSGGKSRSKSGGTSSKPVAGKRKTGGKRPAVAARKTAAKLAAKGGVQKKSRA